MEKVERLRAASFLVRCACWSLAVAFEHHQHAMLRCLDPADYAMS